ncbi:hypothetical protein [Paenibacillus alkalitolerans]|uniref:hypothetical protein n=1 Tax=Paenibacillus alkalitolerans TaxID=2799335 RepID=UPI0018F6FDD5|nr:hypothetical protein [Paenibacillus alkalitolerans]
MERKSVMVQSDVKDDLQKLKDHLKLSNESDVIRYLMKVYEHSTVLPKESQTILLQLQK